MTRYLFPLCVLLLLVSCKKETKVLTFPTVSEYFPLQIGNYIDYDLDSTVFVDLGARKEVVHYQAREVVEEAVTDNLNRPSFRVERYLRKSAGDDWVPSIGYLVTPLNNTVEVVENNLRYIKLVSPIRNNYSWKGNQYIDTYSTDLDLNYLYDWDYTYDSVGVPLTFGALAFDNTIKVAERDEFLGQDPSIPGTPYAEQNVASEKYAKGIGLIYREFLHWEWQSAQPGRAAYYEGYGIRMTITGYGKK